MYEFSTYQRTTFERFRAIAIARLISMNIDPKRLTRGRTSVPFVERGGDRAAMLQDAIRVAAECLLDGELKIALRFIIKARGIDVQLDSYSSDALDIMTQAIEVVLDTVDVVLDARGFTRAERDEQRATERAGQ